MVAWLIMALAILVRWLLLWTRIVTLLAACLVVQVKMLRCNATCLVVRRILSFVICCVYTGDTAGGWRHRFLGVGLPLRSMMWVFVLVVINVVSILVVLVLMMMMLVMLSTVCVCSGDDDTFWSGECDIGLYAWVVTEGDEVTEVIVDVIE